MKIFELKPDEANLNNENWKHTKHYTLMVIRAANEYRARDIAQIVCPTSGEKLSTGFIPTSPWLSSDLVKCSEPKESSCPMEGEEEVLDPLYLNKKLKQSER